MTTCNHKFKSGRCTLCGASQAAVELGRRNAGRPKHISQAESRRRAQRAANARKHRWETG